MAASEQIERWFARNTSLSEQWPAGRLSELKGDRTISVVIPARNEQDTVGEVVERIRRELVDGCQLVDELVVMDSLSTDATARIAAEHGAAVFSVADVAPELGVAAGKGEALWKSLFVTRGELLVFIDADLTEWGSNFVTGLLGPLLADPEVELVKGFYDRIDGNSPGQAAVGGRVTELVARPLLNLHWPQLSRIVQPLAGEWAIRRSLIERLPIPVGYGVELATLLDTWRRAGLPAIAQVDLGRRAHRHQSVHDLAVMAVEVLATGDRRRPGHQAPPAAAELYQYDRAGEQVWRARPVPLTERLPAISVAAYARSAAGAP